MERRVEKGKVEGRGVKRRGKEFTPVVIDKQDELNPTKEPNRVLDESSG